MRLTRRGVFRDCGPSSLISNDDQINFDVLEEGEKRLLVKVTSIRGDRPSYRYRLELKPEDVLKCFLTLPPDIIAEAMDGLREEFDFAEIIPELLKQLAKGAFQTPDDSSNGCIPKMW